MNSDDTEIIDALNHQQNMLRIKRRRLRDREQQQAKYGINAPSEITIEIDDLIESIRYHELELARLQTEAAVNKAPMNEVEYRMLVAEAWEKREGRPSVAVLMGLEYHRLRLGILPEQAQQIERETRSAIAEDLFRLVHPRYYRTRNFPFIWEFQGAINDPIPSFSDVFNKALRSSSIPNLKVTAYVEYPQLYQDKDAASIDTLVKCIYLDYATTLDIYLDHFTKQPLTIVGFEINSENIDEQKELMELAEHFNTSKLARELFLQFRQQLYHSHYATRVNEQHKQITKFIDEVCMAVIGDGDRYLDDLPQPT